MGADTHGNFGRAYGPLTGALQLKEIIFEDGMTKIPAYMCRTTYDDDWSSSTINNIDTILMPDSIESIGDYAFYNCDKITSVTMPKALKTIGQAAYYDCDNISSLQFAYNSVTKTEIGQNAFGSCDKLSNVNLSENITSIGNLAFSGCTLIKDITLPESVTYLGYRFISGTHIQSITIPKSVASVGADTHGNFGRAYGPLTGALQLKEIIFEDGMTKIPAYMCRTTYDDDWSSSTINNIDTILMPDSIESIGDYAFYNCDKITSVTMPKALKTIGRAAYYDCSNLKSVSIPMTVTSIYLNAFSNCNKLTIYGYENSYAEEYALNNDIPFVAIADEDTFIQKHLDFIGAENANNTYHNQLQHFDLAEIALEDYGDLNDTYNLWRTIRGEIFDNPYYTVLSDMILSESAVQGQIESFDIHLDSEWRSIANDIIELINSKVDLTPSQESKIKKMFKKGDFTDETTFKFCQDVLGNKVSKDELNSIFSVYDKTNTFLDIFNQGADIVESVYDTMNYSAILKAYEKTSDEFKVVLMQMAYTCQTENPWLYTTIDKYLKSDYDTEMRNKIVEEVAKNGLSIGKTLFKSSIENKVKAFLINNMDLSKVGTSIASNVLAFVEGCKIGYSIGTGIDNLLFSTDDVSNSFVAASATAKTAGYLKYVLETNEANLRNNPTIRNTVLFCESYNMYKNIQLNTADTMIKYFSKNQTSLINRIFQSNNVLYEHQIYNWQILKLNWQNASCHKGYILNSKLKNVTVACPVDVTVYTNTGEIALQITDNIVQKNNGEIIATVCNNIKYITLPDDSYSIKITATESGTMTYSITDYDAFDHSSKTTCFDGISISKGNEYIGNIVSGSDYSHNDITLCYNNEEVESVVSEFTNEELIKVDSINLSSVSISLKTEETKTISATVEPSNASNKTVTWYSDNPQIAQVDEYGNVTGVSAGKTKIYCVSLEGKVVAECEVKVESRYDIGDTNLDGIVSIRDVTAIQRHLVELETFTEEQLAVADTNGDGEINIADATHLQMFLAEYDGIVLGKS